MERDDTSPRPDADTTAVVPLEISAAVAERADDLLREFAEDAGLDTALIVDRSGALVAGISSESDVTIDVVSALVAGASGAMRALVERIGDSGSMESLHMGEDRLVYLGEIESRFILVGVSSASRPAGLIRQKARLLRGDLCSLLEGVTPSEENVAPESFPVPGIRSIREVTRERAALRQSPQGEPPSGDEASEPSDTGGPPELMNPAGVADSYDVLDPKEILEPLDFGGPEIVIEGTLGPGIRFPGAVDFAEISPFEEEEDEEEDVEKNESRTAALVLPESIFELEEEDTDDSGDDEGEMLSPRDDLAPIFEDGEAPGKRAHPGLGNIFELDDAEDAEDAEEDGSDEIREMIEEDLDSEVRSSGPFYF